MSKEHDTFHVIQNPELTNTGGISESEIATHGLARTRPERRQSVIEAPLNQPKLLLSATDLELRRRAHMMLDR